MAHIAGLYHHVRDANSVSCSWEQADYNGHLERESGGGRSVTLPFK